MSEWYDRYLEFNASRDGVLPAAGISVQLIRVLNTIGSGLLMIAMGLATDTTILIKTIKNPAICIIGILAQFIAMPVTGIILIYALGMHPMEALVTYLFATSPGGGTSQSFKILYDKIVHLREASRAILSVRYM